MSFNPRARDGREQPIVQKQLWRMVSIHAPVMDANNCCAALAALTCFNPRARDGREANKMAKQGE